MVAPERASTSVRSALTAPDALPVVVKLACSRRALDCSSAERSAKGIAIGSPSSALLLSMAAYSLRRATASAMESSGRVPLDMVRKAIRAGVPVLVSKSMPTVQSAELAAEYGLQLVCGRKIPKV